MPIPNTEKGWKYKAKPSMFFNEVRGVLKSDEVLLTSV